MNYLVPEELYYSSSDEWFHVDENLVTIGLTDYRLNQLGEIIFLDLPDEGKSVSVGQIFFNIESVSQIHDFISPISGTVIEVNYNLYDNPGVINDDPYDGGWLVKIEMDHEKDLATLLRSDEYKKKSILTKRAEKPSESNQITKKSGPSNV